MTVQIADIDRVEHHFGRRIRDLSGCLERQESKMPSSIEPLQESCGPTADPAVSVADHESQTVAELRGHGVSAARFKAAFRVASSERM